MSIKERKAEFEAHIDEKVYESVKLTFTGVEGWTVYNCSIPFQWNGREYIYGRVERRDQWANSHVRLFEKTGRDQYAVVRDHMTYQLEDPYIADIQGELTMGGTHVRKKGGEIDTVYGYFFRGTDIENMMYFTSGPKGMKDIRLVDLEDGRIGVFSRPRSKEIEEKFGSASMIGFAVISSLDELTDEVVSNATPIEGIFGQGEWGGCNQAYLLENGKIGIIGHQSYSEVVDDNMAIVGAKPTELAVYVNISFEFDPKDFTVSNSKIIGTRRCYPAGEPKLPQLMDCTFTSGIVARNDGRADLYGGLGDTEEGRITIDYPFSAPIKE